MVESRTIKNWGFVIYLLFILVLWAGLFYAAPKYLHFIVFGDRDLDITLSGIEITTVSQENDTAVSFDLLYGAIESQAGLMHIVRAISVAIAVMIPLSCQLSTQQYKLALLLLCLSLFGAIYFGNQYIEPLRQLGVNCSLSVSSIILLSLMALNSMAIDYYYRRFKQRVLEVTLTYFLILCVFTAILYIPLMFILDWK